jgi:hypothetical protein
MCRSDKCLVTFGKCAQANADIHVVCARVCVRVRACVCARARVTFVQF